MQTKAAVLWAQGAPWSVETIELDEPGPNEVLVRVAAAGMCHSDEHAVTGDAPSPFPVVGGHEGAGTVEKIGSAVSSVSVGDHVVLSFLPSCGRCPSCVNGQQNLCDLGVHIVAGVALSDGGYRAHARGSDLALANMLGAFAQHTVVHEASIVKIDRDIPLQLACLVSCGVATGWGSSVHAGEVAPGDTVVIVGVGGIGMNAVQGARAAGAGDIVVVDPVDWKRERARIFGATHDAPTIESAVQLVSELTRGQMAQCAVLATGVARSEQIGPTVNLVGKRGRVIVTAVAPLVQATVDLSLVELAFWEKTLRGSLYGSSNPRYQIPNLLRLYTRGDLLLDELITKTYPLEDINAGYEDLRSGRNIRGVLVMDDN